MCVCVSASTFHIIFFSKKLLQKSSRNFPPPEMSLSGEADLGAELGGNPLAHGAQNAAGSGRLVPWRQRSAF